MKETLEVLYPEWHRDIMDEYAKGAKEYVMEVFELDEGFMGSRKKMDGYGKTLLAMLLSLYGDYTYSEISQYGYSNIDVVSKYLKNGYGFMDVERDFREVFFKYRNRHRKLTMEIFGTEMENDFTEEKLEVTRVSTNFLYLTVNGKAIRLGMKQCKALGVLAKFTDTKRSGRKVTRKDLLGEGLL